jgi:hypothetical protein
MDIILSLITAIIAGLKDFSSMRPDRKKRLAQVLLRLSRALDECHQAYLNYSQNRNFRQLQHLNRNLQRFREKYREEHQKRLSDIIQSMEKNKRERIQALRSEREAWQKAIKRLSNVLVEHQEILQIFDAALLERLEKYTFNEEFSNFTYSIERVDKDFQYEEESQEFRELISCPEFRNLSMEERLEKMSGFRPKHGDVKYSAPDFFGTDNQSTTMKLRFYIEKKIEQDGSADFEQARTALNAFIKEHTEIADFF